MNLNGKSEGEAGTHGVGALTLSATSRLDFGATSGGNLIQFAGLGTHTGAILQITNWEGTLGAANGTDRLLFAGAGTDFTSRYDQSQASFNSSLGYGIQNYSGFYEVYGISAVPETGTIAADPALLGFVAFRERKRLASIVRINRPAGKIIL